MKIKKIVAMSAAVGVALTGLAFASSASAEPVSNSYVLVGSDTLQDSTNALLNGTRATGSTVRILTADGNTVGSFDAFGTSAIQTKAGGPFFGRPSGSGQGVTALRSSITGNAYSGNAAVPTRVITGQVDIARSSSGPGSNQNANGLLAYVPYARDAVAYAYKGGTAAWANITPGELKQIFDGTLKQIDGVDVHPRLPQAGSGTRNFFLPAIGYASGTTAAPGVSDTGNVTPENDASVLAAGDIIPFSVASWVAQSNGVTGVNTRLATTASDVALGSPVAGVVPFTGTGSALVANGSYYSNGTFGRDTYLVVEYKRIDPSDAAYDVSLANLVNPALTTSLTNYGTFATTPGAVKTKFGFLKPAGSTVLRAYASL